MNTMLATTDTMTLTREAAGLNEELSNLAEYVSTTVSMSSQLGTWWSQNDFDTCQSIQKLVHPRGIYWDNEKKCYLTGEENEVLNLFRSVSVDYEADKIKNQDKSCDLSCLVGYGVEKSKYLLKSFEEIGEFWEYWQRHGRGTILTLLSLFPFVFFLEIIHLS